MRLTRNGFLQEVTLDLEFYKIRDELFGAGVVAQG